MDTEELIAHAAREHGVTRAHYERMKTSAAERDALVRSAIAAGATTAALATALGVNQQRVRMIATKAPR